MYRNHNIISFETRRSNIQETIIIISAICHVKVHWSDIILLVKLVFSVRFCCNMLLMTQLERDYCLVCQLLKAFPKSQGTARHAQIQDNNNTFLKWHMHLNRRNICSVSNPTHEWSMTSRHEWTQHSKWRIQNGARYPKSAFPLPVSMVSLSLRGSLPHPSIPSGPIP